MNATPSYYLSISGKEYGPYSVADLSAAIADNTISPDCPVRPGIGGEWKPASEVVGGAVETPVKAVRRKTEYGWLRGLLSVTAIVALLIIGSLFGYTSYQAILSREAADAIAAAEYLAWGLAVLVAKGLSTVLIDIADVQVMKR